MRQTIVLLAMLYCCQALGKGKDCPKYDKAMKAGMILLQQDSLNKALVRFEEAQIAARECDIKGTEAAEEVDTVFKKLERQRDEAVKQKDVAEKKTAELRRLSIEFDSITKKNAAIEIANAKQKARKTSRDLYASAIRLNKGWNGPVFDNNLQLEDNTIDTLFSLEHPDNDSLPAKVKADLARAKSIKLSIEDLSGAIDGRKERIRNYSFIDTIVKARSHSKNEITQKWLDTVLQLCPRYTNLFITPDPANQGSLITTRFYQNSHNKFIVATSTGFYAYTRQNPDQPKIILNLPARETTMAISDDGTRLVSYNSKLGGFIIYEVVDDTVKKINTINFNWKNRDLRYQKLKRFYTKGKKHKNLKTNPIYSHNDFVIKLSPDNSLMTIILKNANYQNVKSDKLLFIFDLQRPKRVPYILNSPYFIANISFSHDGSKLLVTHKNRYPFLCTLNNAEITRVDSQSLASIQGIPYTSNTQALDYNNTPAYTSGIFAPNDSVIELHSNTGILRVTTNGMPLQQQKLDLANRDLDHSSKSGSYLIYDLTTEGYYQYQLVALSLINIWDSTFTVSYNFPWHQGRIKLGTLSQDGEWVLSGDNTFMYLWKPGDFITNENELNACCYKGQSCTLDTQLNYVRTMANSWYKANSYNYNAIENAIYFYKKAVAIQPNNTDFLQKLGDSYYRHAHYGGISNKAYLDSAIHCYQQALQIDTTNTAILKSVGTCCYLDSDYAQSVLYFSKILKIEPDNKYMWDSLGLAYAGMHDVNNGISAFKSSLKIAPKYDTAWGHMGLVYENISKHDSAIFCYTRQLEFTRDKEIKPGINDALAYNSIKLHRYRNAIYFTRRNILNFPYIHATHHNIGYAALKLGKQKLWKKNMTNYDTEYRANPYDYFYKACYYIKIKADKESAITYLNKAIDKGFKDANWIATETFFNSLHNDAAFKAAIARIH